jgi:hypothetical protein
MYIVQTLHLNRDLLGYVSWSSNFVQFSLFSFALDTVGHCNWPSFWLRLTPECYLSPLIMQHHGMNHPGFVLSLFYLCCNRKTGQKRRRRGGEEHILHLFKIFSKLKNQHSDLGSMFPTVISSPIVCFTEFRWMSSFVCCRNVCSFHYNMIR